MTLLDQVKSTVLRTPLLGPAARNLYGWIRRPAAVDDSAAYWEHRYRSGGNSGSGSYGRLAQFKADFLNDFVASNDVGTVLELGCGDGAQLSLGSYPSYVGVDVSEAAVARCRARFADDPTKSFRSLDALGEATAEMTMSLDVIYHLLEDAVFERHMNTLFDAAERFVVVYATDTDETPRHAGPHVRHRRFTAWVDRHRPDWPLIRHEPNPYAFNGDHRSSSDAGFFVYARPASA